jgi:hypothetical protein
LNPAHKCSTHNLQGANLIPLTKFQNLEVFFAFSSWKRQASSLFHFSHTLTDKRLISLKRHDHVQLGREEGETT